LKIVDPETRIFAPASLAFEQFSKFIPPSISISKNKSLIFTIKDESLRIEKGIFFGAKKILDNACITISGNLVNKNKSFNWEIKKKI
jgi:hypothetical protein